METNTKSNSYSGQDEGQLHDGSPKIIGWLGVDEVAQRRWPRRLPAVLVAGVLLTLFVWSLNIQKEDLYMLTGLSLLLMAFFLAWLGRSRAR